MIDDNLGQDFLASNENNPPINIQPESSETEQIELITSMRSNFVFFFGKPSGGKSAVLSAVLYHLRKDPDGTMNMVSTFDNGEGAKLEGEIQELMNKGRFIDRTKVGSLTYLTLNYMPKKFDPNPYPKLNTTFLEMSGENLKEVSVGKSGRFPSNIDIFFRIPNLPMLFIVVIPWDYKLRMRDEVDKINDDSLVARFFDYVKDKNPMLGNARVMLLISKWDSNPHKETYGLLEFVEQNLPETYAQIKNSKNIVDVFSVGNIGEADNKPYIYSHNKHYPKHLWRQIYMTFTNCDLEKLPEVKRTFWQRFWDNFSFKK